VRGRKPTATPFTSFVDVVGDSDFIVISNAEL